MNNLNEQFQTETAFLRSEKSETKELIDDLRIKLDSQITKGADLDRQISLLQKKRQDNHFAQQLTGAAIKNAENYLNAETATPASNQQDQKSVEDLANSAVADALNKNDQPEKKGDIDQADGASGAA